MRVFDSEFPGMQIFWNWSYLQEPIVALEYFSRELNYYTDVPFISYYLISASNIGNSSINASSRI